MLKIKKILYLLWKMMISVIYFLRYIRNPFVRALFFRNIQINFSLEHFIFLIKMYQNELECINRDLYNHLNKTDKKVFINFLLKRYCGQDTASVEEIEIINRAFSEAEILYKKRKNITEPIKILFRNKNVYFRVPIQLVTDDTSAEKILMNYYDVAQTFFLTEYELEGYNPQDGQTIFDCGAANGDTMLLFRTLYPNSQIHSFEFTEERFQFLNCNAELNNVQNLYKVKAFLYSDSGEHYLNEENFQISEKIVARDKEVNTTLKKIITLSIDDYVKQNNIQNIGLIKFDIEGGEVAALKGAISTIKRQKPLLYIPIYHLPSDIYLIPQFLKELDIPMSFRIKWTEKKVWGVDCVLFVKFL